MRYGDVDIHGIAEAVSVNGQAGVRLQRVPESVRQQLEQPARNKTINPGGAEIRFVPRGDRVRITLSSKEGEGTARLFRGPFASRQGYWIFGEKPVTLEIHASDPEWGSRFGSLTDERIAALPYHPGVCRLVLRQGVVHLHGVEGAARPPEAGETPGRTVIAYGTSITHGTAATAFHLSYVAQTAWRLGCDLVNLGVGGACLAEPAFGDYIAEKTDWDLAILSLSVNMVGQGYTVEDFRRRVGYVVDRVARAHPDKPVACVSLYPFYEDWAHLNEAVKAHPNEFRKALRDVVTGIGTPNLHYLAGPDLLTDIGGLTEDFLHPGDLGMIQMGENLASRLRPLLQESRSPQGGARARPARRQV